MRRSRTLFISAAVSALAISAIGAPVAAAPATGAIVFVNGNPGKTVDVCVNGREIRSELKYGQKATRTIAVGTKSIKFYASDPKTCGGQMVGAKSIILRAGQRQTAVITRKTPKRVVVFRKFEPAAVPSAPPSVGTLRHAADVGAVYLEWELHNIVPSPVEPMVPTAISPFVKGESSEGLSIYAVDPAIVILQASKPVAASPFVQPSIHRIQMFREYDWILVGTTVRNARFVQLSSPLNLP